MARQKNKQTRKYEPRDEFRYNNGFRSKGHPNYVFGYKNGKFKSMGLTTEQNEPGPKVKLSKNPNPLDDRDSYLKLTKPMTDKVAVYGEVLEGWKFANADKPIVRNRIKRYKKSYNRGNKKKKIGIGSN